MKYGSDPGRNERFLCPPERPFRIWGSVDRGDLSPGIERPEPEPDHSSSINADFFGGTEAFKSGISFKFQRIT